MQSCIVCLISTERFTACWSSSASGIKEMVALSSSRNHLAHGQSATSGVEPFLLLVRSHAASDRAGDLHPDQVGSNQLVGAFLQFNGGGAAELPANTIWRRRLRQ